MIVPSMTLPEVIFGGLVLTSFAAFVITLAGVHLYVTLAPRREMPDRRAASPVAGASPLSATGR